MKKIAFIMTSDFNFDQRMMRIYQVMEAAKNRIEVLHRGQGKVPVNTISKKGPIFYLEYNLRIFFHLLFHRYDVVYAVDTDTLGGAGMATYFKKFVLIYDSHEYFIGVPELEDSIVKKYLWKTCERWFVKRAQLCLTVSKSLASILSQEFSCPFYTIRNTPIKAENVVKNNMDQPYFIYQGALNEGRGLVELIDIMVYYPNIILKLAGNGDIKNQLIEKVKVEGIENVKFLGKLSPKELAIATESALIGFNLLSKKSQSYYFSAANKCYDYINMLVPSVNMHFPEYVDLIEEFKVGVTIMDLEPISITFAINHLLDAGNRQKCIEQCILAREVYNWRVEGTKLEKIFLEHGLA